MARENKARYAILGHLSGASASGYDIKKTIQNSTSHFWGENDSSIYPTLKQLYLDECVTCEVQNAETDKPRKIYTITQRGQKELETWLTRDPERSKSRNEFLLKIFFGWNVPTDVCTHHINNVINKCEGVIKIYKSLYQEKSSRKKTKKNVYQLLTLRSGILLTETTIKWCHEALQTLDELQKTESE